jgi:KDO2-lipid IV(A) lauroyltransferase
VAKKSKSTAWLEYAALRFVCAAVNLIPYSVACAMASVSAWTAFNVFSLHKKRTLARIRGCFPEKTEKEIRRIAVISLSNVLMSAVEMIRAPRFDRAWIEKHVKDVHVYASRLKAIADEGKGVVIMVPHSGNWYMAAWAMAKCGVPLFAIAAKQRNKYIDDWMNRQYGDGLEVVQRGSARVMAEIKARLEKGHCFAILPDLRVPVKDVEVPFLNGKANVSHGGAMFAAAVGAPTVVAIMRREGGLHTFDHLGTLRPNPDADRKQEAERITREAMALIDEAVRKTPEYWFWYNKRWILQPV